MIAVDTVITQFQSLVITSTVCVAALTFVVILGRKFGVRRGDVAFLREQLSNVNRAVNHVEQGQPTLIERAADTNETIRVVYERMSTMQRQYESMESKVTIVDTKMVAMRREVTEHHSEYRADLVQMKATIDHKIDVLYAGQQGLEHEVGQIRSGQAKLEAGQAELTNRVTPIAVVAEAHAAGILRTREDDDDEPPPRSSFPPDDLIT